MPLRLFICEGDTLTPGGGKVEPKSQPYPLIVHGKPACYEGDPVYCNTCKSWGVTKCVPPFRLYTDAQGRQINLDGDLCICNCPVPPRLKALSTDVGMGFESSEIEDMPGFSAWTDYSGHNSKALTSEKKIIDLYWSYGDGYYPLSDQSRHVSDINLHVKTINYMAGEMVEVKISSNQGNVLRGKDDNFLVLKGQVDNNGEIVFKSVFAEHAINIGIWG